VPETLTVLLAAVHQRILRRRQLQARRHELQQPERVLLAAMQVRDLRQHLWRLLDALPTGGRLLLPELRQWILFRSAAMPAVKYQVRARRAVLLEALQAEHLLLAPSQARRPLQS